MCKIIRLFFVSKHTNTHIVLAYLNSLTCCKQTRTRAQTYIYIYICVFKHGSSVLQKNKQQIIYCTRIAFVVVGEGKDMWRNLDGCEEWKVYDSFSQAVEEL